MAFQKPLEINNTGATVEYWRITHFQVDSDAGLMEVKVGGYISADLRHAGKQPLWMLNFRISEADFSFEKIELPTLYVHLRGCSPDGGATPFLSDALEV